MSDMPLEGLAFLSDCHSAAVVDRDGTVVWASFPRFDSPSVFGALLDPEAGRWRLGVTDAQRTERRYVDDTLVLETTHETDDGVVVVRDALAVGAGERGHELGAGSPHVLLRDVHCVTGEATVEMCFEPRPEYGLGRPLLCPTDGGIATRGGPDALLLTTDADLEVTDGRAEAVLRLRAGDRHGFALSWSRSWSPAAETFSGDVSAAIDDTVAAWRSWSELHQSYEGPWADLVLHSGRVLQGLTFQPTGAVIAAATTSLPEVVGGERNWDYRYAWIRDASLTLDALWVAACPDEAEHFLAWIVGAASVDLRRGGPLQIMYGVGGEHALHEVELDHLAGWEQSRPVRIGNAAWTQEQLDVYCELLDAVHRLRDQLSDLDEPTRSFLVAVADAAAERWKEADHGIWEIRGAPEHHLYSKLMCWVALDRAVELCDWIGAEERREDWEATRDDIRAAIEDEGWNDEVGAYTQAFGSDVLDASALMLSITGFVSADDARMRATVARIEEELTDDRGLVYRYRGEDGLRGEEGTFLLCTFWLAQVHALAGDVDRAREVFERAVAVRSDVDLLSEEVHAGTMVGNLPQAFSHVGLVNAAWAVHQAEQGRGEEQTRTPTA